MSTGYWPLTDRCLVRVSGADAGRYLNGQLSNDLRKLAPDHALRACLLTAKGKLVADPFVWKEGEGFVIEVRAELQETLLARLERYVVADDVTLEVIANAPTEYHVIGVEKIDGRSINRIGIPGFDVTEPPAGLAPLNADAITAIRIAHALPVWGAELDENVLPAEAGLDTIAIDFHKGCYVGQEVVSRMESAGRTRQTLAVLETRPYLVANTRLATAEGTVVGRITSTIPQKDGGLALAWLTQAAARSGMLLKPAGNESDGLTEIKVIEKLP